VSRSENTKADKLPPNSHMTIRIAIFLILALIVIDAAAVELQVSPDLSTSGTFDLSWQGDEGETYRVVELTGDKVSRLIYQGTDTARVVTGLPDGDYTYRVDGETASSEAISVSVAHHSLTRAFSFFGIGLLVFIATLFLVVRGERGA
jgi:hypothetical protein